MGSFAFENSDAMCAARAVERRTCTMKAPEVDMVLAAIEGVAMLKEMSGGEREKQLKELSVMPRGECGVKGEVAVTITTVGGGSEGLRG